MVDGPTSDFFTRPQMVDMELNLDCSLLEGETTVALDWYIDKKKVHLLSNKPIELARNSTAYSSSTYVDRVQRGVNRKAGVETKSNYESFCKIMRC